MTEPDGENPYQSPPQFSTQKQNCNLVTDTVIGPNVRLKDNLLQALFIGFSIFIGAVIGALTSDPRILGVLVGGFAGMVLGAVWQRHLLDGLSRHTAYPRLA